MNGSLTQGLREDLKIRLTQVKSKNLEAIAAVPPRVFSRPEIIRI